MDVRSSCAPTTWQRDEARLARGANLYILRLLETATTKSIDRFFDEGRPSADVGRHDAAAAQRRLSCGVFAAITSPVLMLHGSYDPHPGKMIRDSLTPHLSEFEYREFERCGHSPWLERFAREDFFATLRSWLSKFCHTRGHKQLLE